MYSENQKKILSFVKDTIPEYYFLNIVAYIINQFDIKERADVPQILGSSFNPIQRALTDFICEVLKIEE